MFLKPARNFGPNDGVKSTKDVFSKKHNFLNIVSKDAPRNSDEFAPGLRSVRFNGAKL